MHRLETPEHAGTRDQATDLLSVLPKDLEGEQVVLDASPLVVGSPSFLDEVVKQLLVERKAESLQIVGGSERARTHLRRAAENRNVRERLQVDVPSVLGS
jgi:hypothetical protein